jgi:hypothetical protein
MPDLIIKAQLKNYDKDVSFKVTFTKLQWTAPNSNPQVITTGYFEGHKQGKGEVEIPFTLPDNYMRGGDDMTIEVWAVAGGTTYKKTLTNPFIIKGKNPTPTTLLAELGGDQYATSDQYAAVCMQESSFRQFYSDGYPLQNGTGFGLMQIDPPPNDDVVWNWVKNVQLGKKYFHTAVTKAKNYQNRHGNNKIVPLPDPLNNDQLNLDPNSYEVFLQAYCYYNGGTAAQYFTWVPADEYHHEPGYWDYGLNSDYQNAVDNTDLLWIVFQKKSWPKQ